MFRSLLLTYCLLISGLLAPASQAYSTRAGNFIPVQVLNVEKQARDLAKVQGDRSQILNSANPSNLNYSNSSAVSDVIIGTPQRIPYSKAFPLLDGIFQDLSAMQVAQLNMNSSTANGSYTNALIQQFQANLQYSQTLGLQNILAAQQGNAYSAAAMLQTQLINQEAQLINLQLAAQQQVAQAQAALNSASADQRDAAQKAYNLANDNLTSITAQLTLVKGYVSNSITAPTFSVPNPSALSFPTPLVAPSPVSPGNNLPSFPASKQMENQVNLLWERLAHLVNTLAQADDPDATSLIVFHTNPMPGKGKRKHELLTTQYALTCHDPNAAGTPQVIDLFPRNAAVNIVNEKYKDSRFGLGALLSFFSIGANAAYNREHLQITQALGQSGYITGFGIERDTFGWVFAPTLGEDTIAPGDRTTFALVTTPKDCGQATVKLIHTAWDKSPNTINWPNTTKQEEPPNSANHSTDPHPESTSQQWNTKSQPEQRCPATKEPCIQNISYAPVEYDPAVANNISVPVDISLNFDLDREETVNVNGAILKRARDTFGRATPTAGSGGLLESQTLDVGTWIPVNARELILNLNPAFFNQQFPTIRLTSPQGSIDLTSELAHADKINIAGRGYTCPQNPTMPCAAALPSIGRIKATSKHFAVARWIVPTNDPTNKDKKRVIITVPETTSSATGTNGTAGIPTLQVITDSQDQTWSAHAKVIAFQTINNDTKSYPLHCEPRGQRLICDAGELAPDQFTDFDIMDSDHSGGAIKGSGGLESCKTTKCPDPLLWQAESPTWNPTPDDQHPNDGYWKFHLFFINVQPGNVATLGTEGNDFFTATIGNCTQVDNICEANFQIPAGKFDLVRDTMQLRVKDKIGNGGSYLDTSPTTLSGLRSLISPLLFSISDDQTHFSGQNLVFNQIQVSPKGDVLNITCANGVDCYLKDKYNAKDDGYLYFVNGSTKILVMLLNDKTITAVQPHHPPKKGQSDTATTNNPSSTLPPTVNVVINNKRSLTAVK